MDICGGYIGQAVEKDGKSCNKVEKVIVHICR